MTRPIREAAPARTAYETCWACKGIGLAPYNINGDPDHECPECDGNGVTRIRDAKGRFSCRKVWA